MAKVGEPSVLCLAYCLGLEVRIHSLTLRELKCTAVLQWARGCGYFTHAKQRLE